MEPTFTLTAGAYAGHTVVVAGREATRDFQAQGTQYGVTVEFRHNLPSGGLPNRFRWLQTVHGNKKLEQQCNAPEGVIDPIDGQTCGFRSAAGFDDAPFYGDAGFQLPYGVFYDGPRATASYEVKTRVFVTSLVEDLAVSTPARARELEVLLTLAWGYVIGPLRGAVAQHEIGGVARAPRAHCTAHTRVLRRFFPGWRYLKNGRDWYGEP